FWNEEESFRLYVSGINNLDEGRLELAIQDFNDALELKSNSASYYIARAIAYGKTGKFHLGIDDLHKAVSIDHKVNEAYWLLAEYYIKSDKIEDGQQYFTGLLENIHSNPYIYLNRGQLFYYTGDLDKALSDFEKSTELDPGFKYGYTARGAIYIANEDWDQAETVLLKAVELDKEYPEPYLYLSLVYAKKGDETRSNRYREKAIRLKPALELVDLSESMILRGKKVSVKFMTTTLDLVYIRLLTMEQRDLLSLPQKHFVPNLGVGSTTIQNDSWFNIKFEPEIDYKNFGMQLSFRYLFNNDGEIKKEELSHHKIIQRLRLGREYGPVMAYIGNIEDLSIGYGFIVRNYMNRLSEDEQRIGGRFILQTKRGTIGFEGLVNDLEDPNFFAGRFYFGKFGKYRSSFLQRFELGFSFATDIDPDMNSETTDSLTVTGGDILMYLGSRNKFSFALFGEGAQIQDYGSGFISGLLMIIGSPDRNESKFQVFGGMINKGENFEPAVFDTFYESQKYWLAENSTSNTTALLINASPKQQTGQFYLASFNIKRFFQTNVEFQSFPDKKSGGTFSFKMMTLDNAPFELYAIYIQNKIDSLGEVSWNENFDTYTQAYLAIPFLRFFKFFIEYKKTYNWDETLKDYVKEERTEPNVVFSYRF
ncbi:MAG TPA: tetratricopeptide repeat protein, partial [Firmicutes bacterium]|nr:tetratricopeptide repeat protein [Bacillota bacterium]